MKRRLKAALGWVAVAGIVGTATMGSGPAFASDSETGSDAGAAQETYELLDSSSDPLATFDALPLEDQIAFTDYFLPVDEVVTVTLTPLDARSAAAVKSGTVGSDYASMAEAQSAVAAASGCWGGYVRRTAYSAANIGLYDIHTEGKWCGNGTRATSATFSRSWSTIGVIGWRDAGQIDKGAGVYGGQARIWAQRKMIFGAGGIDLQEYRPCLRLNGHGNGGKSLTVVCSIY
ncbi:hypothetical protein KZC51_14270 [Microbacterium sp. SSW1-49]|uniref:Secreted protein n=1 Tax=Microbacterium croceum TaxID=2851645 RepID=A0ABT0FGW8_9MICO|nr:hypothetical protein [Microbacterium croceum]MCK2037296.1 hypothetical protein [Microbacterium croceum]